jgi:hypothetical protein
MRMKRQPNFEPGDDSINQLFRAEWNLKRCRHLSNLPSCDDLYLVIDTFGGVPGANPTTSIYNDNVVKINNALSSLLSFESKIF